MSVGKGEALPEEDRAISPLNLDRIYVWVRVGSHQFSPFIQSSHAGNTITGARGMGWFLC